MAPDPKTFAEKRDFFRIAFNTPLEYKTYSVDKSSNTASQTRTTTVQAQSRNISQSGILFQTTKNPPQLSSFVWMNLDIRTLRICQEIEKKALVYNNGLLGKVVRVEEDDANNSYDIGVCFLTVDQKDSQEVTRVLSELAKTA